MTIAMETATTFKTITFKQMCCKPNCSSLISRSLTAPERVTRDPKTAQRWPRENHTRREGERRMRRTRERLEVRKDENEVEEEKEGEIEESGEDREE